MQCVICNKYSGHTSDINLDKFRIDGIDYIYPVCQTSQDGRFTEPKGYYLLKEEKIGKYLKQIRTVENKTRETVEVFTNILHTL